MPARGKVLLTKMPNRYRQKKMGFTPIIFLPVVASEPHTNLHAQRLCEFSIFRRVLQSGERARAPVERSRTVSADASDVATAFRAHRTRTRLLR